jgi:hypothetical protein
MLCRYCGENPAKKPQKYERSGYCGARCNRLDVKENLQFRQRMRTDHQIWTPPEELEHFSDVTALYVMDLAQGRRSRRPWRLNYSIPRCEEPLAMTASV